MKPAAVKSILNILLTLQAQSEWQVRHGGLLGIKYLLAVRKDMTDQLFPVVLSPLIRGLEDSDDDVRAVSATAMLPVVDQMLHMSDQVMGGLGLGQGWKWGRGGGGKNLGEVLWFSLWPP
jgi:TATA-binding protein-associated factor